MSTTTAAPPSTTITPPGRLGNLSLSELWHYRELLFVIAARDIKVRYKQALIGASWAVLRPLVMMVIFTIIFGRVAKLPSEGHPYTVFVFSGLLPWTLFSTALGKAAASLLGSAQLLRKVYFPRLLIPMASVTASLVDYLISTVILLALMVYYEVTPSLRLLLFPVLTLLTVAAAFGMGCLLTSISVKYRDLNHLTPFLVQTWLYVTPVIYPLSSISEKWQWLMSLNPMTGIVQAFRATFLGDPYDFRALAVSAAITLLFVVVGVLYFQSAEKEFADVV